MSNQQKEQFLAIQDCRKSLEKKCETLQFQIQESMKSDDPKILENASFSLEELLYLKEEIALLNRRELVAFEKILPLKEKGLKSVVPDSLLMINIYEKSLRSRVDKVSSKPKEGPGLSSSIPQSPSVSGGSPPESSKFNPFSWLMRWSGVKSTPPISSPQQLSIPHSIPQKIDQRMLEFDQEMIGKRRIELRLRIFNLKQKKTLSPGEEKELDETYECLRTSEAFGRFMGFLVKCGKKNMKMAEIFDQCTEFTRKLYAQQHPHTHSHIPHGGSVDSLGDHLKDTTRASITSETSHLAKDSGHEEEEREEHLSSSTRAVPATPIPACDKTGQHHSLPISPASKKDEEEEEGEFQRKEESERSEREEEE
ncbi:hypothetical protein ADUPG1_006787 [Aduncisulcus paluster]|uniref:Uncharacterized protein n=1 Tax=Aduncisulcus paluster TaxID=2918883 RepID=A0ABQ5KJL3_9EUKA|nr:hypothetical protein ADUPG1_006787 [Aduncisulcus paluster]